MTPWDDQYVRDLVDELERRGKVSAEVAERAHAAADAERYTEALRVVLDDDVRGVDPASTTGADAGPGDSDPPDPIGRASED